MTGKEKNRPIVRYALGQWDYRPDEDGKPITNGQVAIAYMDAYVPDEDDGGAWEKETEANGRLIAAAPELLEALDYLLEQTVDMDLKYGIGLSEGEEDARAKALAAIAEATGAAPASPRQPIVIEVWH